MELFFGDLNGLLAKEAIGLLSLARSRQILFDIGDDLILDQIANGLAFLNCSPLCQHDSLFLDKEIDMSLHRFYSSCEV